MLPRGYTGCGPTPENGREGPSRDPGIYSCLNAAWLMTLRPTPLSISTWCSRMLVTTGAMMSGSTPAPAMLSGQSDAPKEMVVLLHHWCGAALGTPRDHRKNLPSQGLDVPMGGELPTSATHYVQLLAAVVVVARVKVSGEDILEVPLGRLVLEVLSRCRRGFFVGPLLAGPATRWRVVLGGLLAPLANALREFDNLAAVGGAVAAVGVHRACATVASLGPRALVAITPAPGHGSNDRSSNLWLLMAAVLVLLFLLATALGDSTRAARLGNLGLWRRVPCMALGGSDTLVGQSEERGDVVHVMRGQLL
jgi:hypothetical protein